MKNKLVVALFLSLSLFGYSQQSDDRKTKRVVSDETKLTFEQNINQLYRDNGLLGDFIIGLVDETGFVYSHRVNQELLAGKTSSLSNNSPLYIASHTKSFTGTLLKRLEEQGKLDLNKSLYDYLPELHFNDSINTKEINVKMLLNHTHGTHSSIFTWKTAILGYSGQNSELINDFNESFLHDPSHQFRYSNTGPIVAAMIAEKITGKSWKQLMKEEIFEPLHMYSTSTYVSNFKQSTILPAVTANPNGKIIHSGFYKKDITMHAAGGILSTVNDLSVWLQANINQNNLLKDWGELHSSTTSQKRSYFTYPRHGYSLGWDIATYQSDTILTRFGGFAGLSFHASFLPNKKLGVIAFSTDERATLLPHLAANYLYNLILRSSKAGNTFQKEKILFEEDYQETAANIFIPDSKKLVTQGKDIVGHYMNDKGWPDIEIVQLNDNVILKWGILEGKVYRNSASERKYVSDLVVLIREFDIEGDTLYTGSLTYIKNRCVENKKGCLLH